jgi:hypothetical protein
MQALAIALAAGLTALSFQDKPGAVPKKGDVVSVKGCIRAGAIESNEIEIKDGTDSYTGFVTLRIAGDKKVVNPEQNWWDERKTDAKISDGLKASNSKLNKRQNVFARKGFTISGENLRKDGAILYYFEITKRTSSKRLAYFCIN